MEIIDHLAIGFGAAATPHNIFFCLIGCLVGTLIGVLPGIGPLATIAMLLPITYGLEPLTSLIMLAGIYYGAQYGGSTTAILVNLPGEASSTVTMLDGYQMARNGRAGAALAVAAIGSFFAGTVGTLLIAAVGPILGEFSLRFRGPEYFSLMLLGLVAAVILAHGSVLKAIGAILLGLLLGLVGMDVTSGVQRFTFGNRELVDGLDFVSIAMGIFGFAEIVRTLERPLDQRDMTTQRIGKLWPNREESLRSAPAILRGTLLGSVLGFLPGGGAVLSSFSAYTIEKKISRDPSQFGKGAVEGVAAPEAANNAAAQTSFIPLLTLGLPSHPVMALMMGAMMMHGIAPGTAIIKDQPVLFWGMIASMWIGNLMLLVLNLPLISVWVKLLQVPYRLLFPCIVLFCCVGAYSLDGRTFEVTLVAIFAIVGYAFAKVGCEGAPFILGFVLGPLMEENLRRALLLSRGDPMVFLQRPISAFLIACAAALLLLIVLPQFRKTREEAFQE